MTKVLGSQEDLMKIINVVSRINTIREIDPLLRGILNAAVELIDAQAGSIILKESEGFFTIRAAIGDKAEQFMGIKIPVGKGIVGWTIENNKSLLIADVTKDTRWYSKSDKDSGFKTQSIICVPLAIDDNVIGAVEVLNKNNGALYDERDEQILGILAAQAAATIYNLMLYKEVLESKKKIETIINGMADAVLLLDADHRITVANPSAKQIFKCKEGIAEENSSLGTLINEVKLDKNSDLLDVVLLKPEGAVLSCKTTYLDNSAGKRAGAILALRNVTAIKQKERRKSEVLMIIVHQMKEPIARLIKDQKEKVAGLTDLVISQKEIGYLERIEFVSELLNKLVYYASIDAGPMRLERKPQKILPVINPLIEELRKFAGNKKVKIEVVIDKDLDNKYVKFDSETISETIKNIAIASVLRSRQEDVVSVKISETETRVSIGISDRGDSVIKDGDPNIFSLEEQVDKFITSDEELADLNLTYAFAHYVMSAHGGEIEVTCKGKENVAVLSLPKG